MPTDTAPAPARTTSLDPRVERSRAAILKATIELISEEGFSACTIDAVVRQTGIAKATIYRHWPSREALLKAAIDKIGDAGEAPDTGSLRGDLIEFFTSRAREMGQNPIMRRLQTLPAIFEAARRDPGFADMSAKFIDGLIINLVSMLRRGRLRGEINAEGDLEAMANLILGGFLIRHGFRQRAFSDDASPADIDLLISGFRGSGGPKSDAAGS